MKGCLLEFISQFKIFSGSQVITRCAMVMVACSLHCQLGPGIGRKTILSYFSPMEANISEVIISLGDQFENQLNFWD